MTAGAQDLPKKSLIPSTLQLQQ